MVDHAAIKKAIKHGLKSKSILTEADARQIAKQYITDDEPDYEITLSISGLLPKTVNCIVSSKTAKHSWFSGDVEHTVYVDDFGRMWSKSTGKLKSEIPTLKVNGHFIIDKLGGMVWNSKDGINYVCEYRTSPDELNNRIAPQTFIGIG